jgi:hypothetical protein
MTVPRVVIGRRGTGLGLYCSLPGVNALTADANDSNRFSFNSDWTDLLKVHQMGTVSDYSVSEPPFVKRDVYFPALSYVPYVEARLYDRGRYYNDVVRTYRYDTGTGFWLYTVNAAAASITRNSIRIHQVASTRERAFYVVYALSSGA